MTHYKRYTDDDLNRIIELAGKGVTNEMIGKRMRRSRAAITCAISRTLNTRKQIIISLCESGYTPSEILTKLRKGATKPTIAPRKPSKAPAQLTTTQLRNLVRDEVRRAIAEEAQRPKLSWFKRA